MFNAIQLHDELADTEFEVNVIDNKINVCIKAISEWANQSLRERTNGISAGELGTLPMLARWFDFLTAQRTENQAKADDIRDQLGW
jgi:hypothetical protein